MENAVLGREIYKEKMNGEIGVLYSIEKAS